MNSDLKNIEYNYKRLRNVLYNRRDMIKGYIIAAKKGNLHVHDLVIQYKDRRYDTNKTVACLIELDSMNPPYDLPFGLKFETVFIINNEQRKWLLKCINRAYLLG